MKSEVQQPVQLPLLESDCVSDKVEKTEPVTFSKLTPNTLSPGMVPLWCEMAPFSAATSDILNSETVEKKDLTTGKMK